MKLADAVGHNRVAINFKWTLITGFLVMFMQAGFALVETGPVPGEKLRPHHGDELHDLSHGHAGILPLRVRLHVRRHGRSAYPIGGGIATMGGYAGLNNEFGFTIGGHFIGLLGLEGIPAPGRGL